MAETATKQQHKPVVTMSANHQSESPVARLTDALERTSELSDELLGSLEKGERAAIEAVGRFVITVEEAVPQEVAGTADVAKKLTESGLETADRLIHTQYEVLRKAIDSTAKALRGREVAQVHVAR